LEKSQINVQKLSLDYTGEVGVKNCLDDKEREKRFLGYFTFLEIWWFGYQIIILRI
jgi:hypothetical protein